MCWFVACHQAIPYAIANTVHSRIELYIMCEVAMDLLHFFNFQEKRTEASS